MSTDEKNILYNVKVQIDPQSLPALTIFTNALKEINVTIEQLAGPLANVATKFSNLARSSAGIFKRAGEGGAYYVRNIDEIAVAFDHLNRTVPGARKGLHDFREDAKGIKGEGWADASRAMRKYISEHKESSFMINKSKDILKDYSNTLMATGISIDTNKLAVQNLAVATGKVSPDFASDIAKGLAVFGSGLTQKIDYTADGFYRFTNNMEFATKAASNAGMPLENLATLFPKLGEMVARGSTTQLITFFSNLEKIKMVGGQVGIGIEGMVSIISKLPDSMTKSISSTKLLEEAYIGISKMNPGEQLASIGNAAKASGISVEAMTDLISIMGSKDPGVMSMAKGFETLRNISATTSIPLSYFISTTGMVPEKVNKAADSMTIFSDVAKMLNTDMGSLSVRFPQAFNALSSGADRSVVAQKMLSESSKQMEHAMFSLGRQLFWVGLGGMFAFMSWTRLQRSMQQTRSLVLQEIQAELSLADSRKNVTDTLEQYGADSDEYRSALRKQKIEAYQLQISNERLRQSFTDSGQAAAMFGMSTLGQLVGIGGNMRLVMHQMKIATDGQTAAMVLNSSATATNAAVQTGSNTATLTGAVVKRVAAIQSQGLAGYENTETIFKGLNAKATWGQVIATNALSIAKSVLIGVATMGIGALIGWGISAAVATQQTAQFEAQLKKMRSELGLTGEDVSGVLEGHSPGLYDLTDEFGNLNTALASTPHQVYATGMSLRKLVGNNIQIGIDYKTSKIPIIKESTIHKVTMKQPLNVTDTMETLSYLGLMEKMFSSSAKGSAVSAIDLGRALSVLADAQRTVVVGKSPGLLALNENLGILNSKLYGTVASAMNSAGSLDYLAKSMESPIVIRTDEIRNLLTKTRNIKEDLNRRTVKIEQDKVPELIYGDVARTMTTRMLTNEINNAEDNKVSNVVNNLSQSTDSIIRTKNLSFNRQSIIDNIRNLENRRSITNVKDTNVRNVVNTEGLINRTNIINKENDMIIQRSPITTTSYIRTEIPHIENIRNLENINSIDNVRNIINTKEAIVNRTNLINKNNEVVRLRTQPVSIPNIRTIPNNIENIRNVENERSVTNLRNTSNTNRLLDTTNLINRVNETIRPVPQIAIISNIRKEPTNTNITRTMDNTNSITNTRNDNTNSITNTRNIENVRELIRNTHNINKENEIISNYTPTITIPNIKPNISTESHVTDNIKNLENIRNIANIRNTATNENNIRNTNLDNISRTNLTNRINEITRIGQSIDKGSRTIDNSRLVTNNIRNIITNEESINNVTTNRETRIKQPTPNILPREGIPTIEIPNIITGTQSTIPKIAVNLPEIINNMPEISKAMQTIDNSRKSNAVYLGPIIINNNGSGGISEQSLLIKIRKEMLRTLQSGGA